MSAIATRSTMTEAEWLASDDPAAMLDFCRNPAHPGNMAGQPYATDRKLRLFACACCRQVWDGAACSSCTRTPGKMWENAGGGDYGGWFNCPTCSGSGRIGGLTDPRSRRAVEVAERYADGEATDDELLASHESARAAWNADITSNPAGLAVYCGHRKPIYAAQRINHHNLKDVPPPATQAALLRDIVGNPWRPMRDPWSCRLCGGSVGDDLHCDQCSALQPLIRWLSWSDGTVPKLARAIYDERAWEQMPVLADALEEAGVRDEPCPYCKDADFGCNDLGGTMMGGEEPYASRAKAYWNRQCVCKGTRRIPHPILAHCRGPGPHARGCWVVDLLLGKI